MLINTNIDWLTHDSFMIITKQCVFLQVRWENGKRGDYSFGADGKYEVVLWYLYYILCSYLFIQHLIVRQDSFIDNYIRLPITLRIICTYVTPV